MTLRCGPVYKMITRLCCIGSSGYPGFHQRLEWMLGGSDIAFATCRQRPHPFVEDGFNSLAVQYLQSIDPQNE
jgi:hypothetical protein